MNNTKLVEATCKIELADCNLVTVVDECDYDYLTQWKWAAIRGANDAYFAYRQEQMHRIYMHREIAIRHGMNAQTIQYINGNTLDNRLENLKAIGDITRNRKPKARKQGRPQSASLKLTTRQRQIVELKSQGFTAKQIALELSITPRTVDAHMEDIYDKIGVNNLAELLSIVNCDRLNETQSNSVTKKTYELLEKQVEHCIVASDRLNHLEQIIHKTKSELDELVSTLEKTLKSFTVISENKNE